MTIGGFNLPFNYTEEEKKQILGILDKVLLPDYKDENGYKKIIDSLENNAGLLLSLGEQTKEKLSKREIRKEIKNIEKTIADLMNKLHNLSDISREKLDLTLLKKYSQFSGSSLQSDFRSSKGDYPIESKEILEKAIHNLNELDATFGDAIRELLKENLKGRDRNEIIRSYFLTIAHLYKSFTGEEIKQQGTFQEFFEVTLKPMLKEFKKRCWELPIKPNTNKPIDEMDFSNAIEGLIKDYKKSMSTSKK